MDPNQLKHLEMIQAIITRLAGNSFMIRGWSITLVSALLGFAFKDWNWPLVAACFFPNLMFWVLDSIYLLEERKFRWLFDEVRQGRVTGFDMNRDKAGAEPKNKYWNVFSSRTTLVFHGALFILIAAGLACVLLAPRPSPR